MLQVDDVQILGTQPWPIGRYGSCELMIGCIAKARSYEVLLNSSEMEDVQWYDREELMAAVKLYEKNMPLTEIQKRSWSSLGFFVPPPFAIAHHLIKTWAGREGPWYGQQGPGSIMSGDAGVNGSTSQPPTPSAL